MQTIKTQIGTAMTADFEESTWTFLMPKKYEVRAGKFAIVDNPVYDEMVAAIKDCLRSFEQNRNGGFNGEGKTEAGSPYVKVKELIDKL